MNTLDFILKKYGLAVEYPVKLDIKRNNLATLFKELGFKVGVEVGVFNGDYSKALCLANPELKLYSIDPWQGEDEPSEKIAREMLKPYNCEIIKKTSMEAVKDFKPESIDFVYIDGDHSFESVTEDLNAWEKIVRKGGIISGHDYFRVRFSHRRKPVRIAVDKYLNEHNIEKFFMVSKNHQSSWFWVKGEE